MSLLYRFVLNFKTYILVNVSYKSFQMFNRRLFAIHDRFTQWSSDRSNKIQIGQNIFVTQSGPVFVQ